MIKISKSERDALKKVGLLKFKRVGHNYQEPNFTVANREHLGRDKHTYVVEEPEILLFLGKYDSLNLQKITEQQYDSLLKGDIITSAEFQPWGKYVPNALVFEDAFGQKRIKRISKMMVYLGLW